MFYMPELRDRPAKLHKIADLYSVCVNASWTQNFFDLQHDIHCDVRYFTTHFYIVKTGDAQIHTKILENAINPGLPKVQRGGLPRFAQTKTRNPRNHPLYYAGSRDVLPFGSQPLFHLSDRENGSSKVSH